MRSPYWIEIALAANLLAFFFIGSKGWVICMIVAGVCYILHKVSDPYA